MFMYIIQINFGLLFLQKITSKLKQTITRNVPVAY